MKKENITILCASYGDCYGECELVKMNIEHVKKNKLKLKVICSDAHCRSHKIWLE